MRKILLIGVLFNLVVLPAFAEKPPQAGAGSGKMNSGHYEFDSHKESMQKRDEGRQPMDKGMHENVRSEKSEMDRAHERLEGEVQGLEKQQEMKAGQEMKESGQGSEQGQETREEHSRNGGNSGSSLYNPPSKNKQRAHFLT